MKLFRFDYSDGLEEAICIFEGNFFAMDRVIQLDCLQDAIYELTDIYQRLLNKDEK